MEAQLAVFDVPGYLKFVTDIALNVTSFELYSDAIEFFITKSSLD